jgi:hypothetical protein
MRKIALTLFGTFLAWVLGPMASANVLIYEPFDYTAGLPIANQTNTYSTGSPVWNASGATTSPVHQITNLGGSGSLTGPSGFPASIGNTGAMMNADNTQLDRMNLPSVVGANSSLYYSLLLNVPSTSGLTTANTNVNANNDIIVGFNNITGGSGTKPSVWAGELVIRLGSAASTFNFGIRASTTAAGTTFFTGDLSINTTYLVVGRYTQGPTAGAGGVNSLWINPSSVTFGGTAPTPDGNTNGNISTNPLTDAVASLLVGGGVAAGAAPSQTNIDEIRVGTTWADVTSLTAVPESSAGLFMLLGGILVGSKSLRPLSRRLTS